MYGCKCVSISKHINFQIQKFKQDGLVKDENDSKNS